MCDTNSPLTNSVGWWVAGRVGAEYRGYVRVASAFLRFCSVLFSAIQPGVVRSGTAGGGVNEQDSIFEVKKCAIQMHLSQIA